MNSMCRLFAYTVIYTLFSYSSVQAQTIQNINHSADFYRTMQTHFLDQPVTIYVTYLMPGSEIENLINGYRVFVAFTEDGDSSGTIDVAVPISAIDYYISNYGTSLVYHPVNAKGELFPITRPLTGTLLKYTSGMIYGGELIYLKCSAEQDSLNKQTTPVNSKGRVIPNTGDFYLAFQDRYLNQDVTIYVSQLKTLLKDSLAEKEDILNGYRYLVATTYNEGQLGGYIFVAVPSTSVKKAINKYGEEPRWNPSYGKDPNESPHKTQPLSGTLLRNKQGRPFILYSDPP